MTTRDIIKQWDAVTDLLFPSGDSPYEAVDSGTLRRAALDLDRADTDGLGPRVCIVDRKTPKEPLVVLKATTLLEIIAKKEYPDDK